MSFGKGHGICTHKSSSDMFTMEHIFEHAESTTLFVKYPEVIGHITFGLSGK